MSLQLFRLRKIIYDSLGIGLITSIEPAPLVKVLGSFGGSDVYPTGSALNMMLSTANRVVNISENYGLKSGILPPQNALDWTDENNLPGWVGTNANAVLVKVGDPYMLVQAQYLSGYVSAGVEVQLDSNVDDAVELSFDFAYVATFSIASNGGTDIQLELNPPTANLKVIVSIMNPPSSTVWYLSNQLGWVKTYTELNITGVAAMCGIKGVPDWRNYKITAGPMPSDGTLSVFLFRPEVIPPAGATMILGEPVFVNVFGAGFKNININLLKSGKTYSPGIDYNVILNNSTKAAENKISWIGGDLPDDANGRLIYSNFTSLSDGTLTGQWNIPGGDTMPLIELIGRIQASQNRRPKQSLTGTIRGGIIDFDIILQHNYPTSRKFEILEASYDLCLDKASVTLVELFEHEEPSYTVKINELNSSSSSQSNSSGGGGSGSTIINNITNNNPRIGQFIIPFTNEKAPSILNYNSVHAATFGQYPVIRLFIYDGDGNVLPLPNTPKLLMINSLVDSIVFDLGQAESGFIIIS